MTSFVPSGYMEVPAEDKASIEEKSPYSVSTHQHYHSLSFRTYTCVGLLVFSLWASSIFIAVRYPLKATASSSTDISTPKERIGCGSSSMEAKALGCTFDPMTTSWLRKECPRDGTEEYLLAYEKFNLSYWIEEDGKPSDKRIANFEEFSHMDGQWYWSTFYEHLFHCVYMLKRTIHVERRRGRLDTISQDIVHTDHCLEFIMQGLASPPEELAKFQRTESPMTFLKC